MLRGYSAAFAPVAEFGVVVWAVLSREGGGRRGYGGPWRLGRLLGLAPMLALSLCLHLALSGQSQANERNLSYILIDAETEAVLDSHNAGSPRYTASLAKLMSAYLALEALDAGLISETQQVKVSRHAAAQPPTKAGLRSGETVRFGEVLAASVVASANDAAVVVAEALTPNEAVFAARMTDKAYRLGMTGTRFGNASGLPHRDNVTTARDMAILGAAVLRRFTERQSLFSRTEARIGKRRLSTTNALLGSFPGATGLKTGFTCWSGYNIVAAAERKGRTLIAVVLGAKTKAARNLKAIRLLQAGFRGSRTEPRLRKVGFVQNAARGEGEPPEILSAPHCGGSGVRTASATQRFRGWGVLLGTFTERQRAETVMRESLSLLTPAQRKMEGTILSSRRGSIRRFTALLSGLPPRESASICRRLREASIYCLAMGPKALNNPRAAWR